MKITDAVKQNPAMAEKILTGARAVFVDAGFDGALVDDIATHAEVSKATLYRYFPDKKIMFQACVKSECDKQARQTFTFDQEAVTIEEVLRSTALQFTTFLLDDASIELFRIAFSEVRRFPDIGHEFYDSGPGPAHQRLSQMLKDASDRGELNIDNPDLAAEQFTELCRADIFLKRMLGVKTSVTPQEIEQIANAVVTFFMRAYGPSRS